MPVHYRVIVSPQAFDDLNAILSYIAHDSPRNAVRMIDRLWKATQSLDQLPHRFKVFRHRRRAELIIRSMPVPPYIVYYRVVEETRTVRVLTIWHGKRRQPKRFEA